MDRYYLTKKRLEELQVELEDLKTRKRFEVAERLKQAKEFGDLTENSEYSEARNQQEQVEKRIYELEDILKRVVLIEEKESFDVVAVGSKVTVRRGTEVFRYHIVGSNETKPEEGKISDESPLGRAFLNRKAGDTVTITTPSGSATYEIIKIE